MRCFTADSAEAYQTMLKLRVYRAKNKTMKALSLKKEKKKKKKKKEEKKGKKREEKKKNSLPGNRQIRKKSMIVNEEYHVS